MRPSAPARLGGARKRRDAPGSSWEGFSAPSFGVGTPVTVCTVSPAAGLDLSCAAGMMSRSFIAAPLSLQPRHWSMREPTSNRAMVPGVLYWSITVRDGGDEPGPCISPIGVGGAGRYVEGGSSFRNGQAGEIAEFHHLGRPRFQRRQAVE